MDVHALDVVIAAVVLLSAALAYFRGFVREALGLGAWIGAAAATVYGYDVARPYARDLIPVAALADLAAAVVLFVVTLVILSILGSMIAGSVRGSSHSAVDRSLGFLFGIFRGALLVGIVFMVGSWIVPPGEQPRWVNEARVTPVARAMASQIETMLPDDLRGDSRREAERAQQAARDAQEAKRLLDKLNNPAPAVRERDAEAPTGYSDADRQGLETLIQRSN